MKTKASSEIYVLDVPEVEKLSTEFVYNFFTVDETINENFIDESKFSTFERNFEGYVASLRTQVPRFVSIRFKTIETRNEIGDPKKDYEAKIREQQFKQENKGIIRNNLGKIVSEDHFSTGYFSSVQFKGGTIKDIAYGLTSGSITQFMYDKYYRQGASMIQKSRSFASSFDQSVNPEFVMASMADSDNHNGVNRFNVYEGAVGGIGSKITQFDQIKEVYAHGQVNNKVFSDIASSFMVSSYNPVTIGLKNLILDLKNKQISVLNNLSQKTISIIPFISVSNSDIEIDLSKIESRLVGYVIDKVEILKDSIIIKDQIVIEGQQFGSLVDFNVKYGSTYMYAVRAIYKVKLPVYDETLDRLSIATILVSSSPSESKNVMCLDTVSPPSPADFTFHWDNENDRLMLRWSFPLNTQRDIKKFQVFRRKSIRDPFELIKQYDFNDAAKVQSSVENPDSSLIEKVSSPKTVFFDDEFGKDSRYMYAVASIDAHELTSEYSDQFEVWFDKRRNHIKKRLISHSGAPKQYPNLFLEKDLFVDTINVEKKTVMSVYFTPDFFNYIDNDENEHDTFVSNHAGGSYKMSIMNIDNQKSETIIVNINDRRPKSPVNENPSSPPFSSIFESKGKFGSGGKGKF